MTKSDQRIRFIDTARIYGVTLVYYGHFIESYMKAGSAVAAYHYKFIYSFHMVLFFILSGYIAKKQPLDIRGRRYLKRLAASRLLPYAFLSLLLMVPTFWITDFTAGLELPTKEGYLKGLAATFLSGFPYFNIPTWFLICLFVVELMNYTATPYLTSHRRVIFTAFGFYLVGSILAWNARFLNPINILSPHGKIYPYFMVLEAFTAYSFYLVGVFLRRSNFLLKDVPWIKCFTGVLICLTLVYLTFDLNKGMFTIPFYDAVVMLGSSHGNPILFPLTSITGSLMILFLAKLTPNFKSLSFLGRNSLIIFGLNGFFYHFVNDRLALWLLSQHAGESLSILTTGIVVSIMSLLLTVPCVFLLNTCLPQLLGKPRKSGPLLPSLVG